jgi:hypothetical protein
MQLRSGLPARVVSGSAQAAVPRMSQQDSLSVHVAMERHGFAQRSVPGVFLVHEETHYGVGFEFQGVEPIANLVFQLSA